MNKKKILFIANELSFLFSHRLEIINNCSKLFDTFAICKNNLKKESNNLKIYDLNLKKNYLNIFIYIYNVYKLKKIINVIKPDIIHVIGIKPIILFSLLSPIFKNKVKIIYSFAGLGIIFSSKNLILKILSKLIKFQLNFLNDRKIIYIFQKNYDVDRIFNNKKVYDNKIIIIPGSGVDLKNIRYINYQKSFRKKIIIFVSRIKKSKGIYDFINYVSEINKSEHSYEFRVAGKFDSTIMNSYFKDKILSLFIKHNIKYDGQQNDIYNYLSNSSLLIFPSNYGEGIPKILLEAIAVGLPIISEDIPGISNIVVDNYNGYKINFKNIHKVIKFTNKIFSSKNNYKNFSEYSIKLSKKYDVEDVVNKHLKIYQ